MNETGYWIVISCGFDPKRDRLRQWDALVVSVLPQDTEEEPDLAAIARERPGRVILIGVWSPQTGWALSATEGPPRLRERFAVVAWECQAPTRAAIRLGVLAAMRLCLGLSGRDRDPFPAPGAN